VASDFPISGDGIFLSCFQYGDMVDPRTQYVALVTIAVAFSVVYSLLIAGDLLSGIITAFLGLVAVGLYDLRATLQDVVAKMDQPAPGQPRDD
jgi:hypothetical protein